MNGVPRQPPLILFIHNHSSVESLLDYLTGAGLRVAHTHNDGNMIATVLRVTPDLIVLDFNIDGETAARLKGDVRTQAIPIIALAEMVKIDRDSLALKS